MIEWFQRLFRRCWSCGGRLPRGFHSIVLGTADGDFKKPICAECKAFMDVFERYEKLAARSAMEREDDVREEADPV